MVVYVYTVRRFLFAFLENDIGKCLNTVSLVLQNISLLLVNYTQRDDRSCLQYVGEVERHSLPETTGSTPRCLGSAFVSCSCH